LARTALASTKARCRPPDPQPTLNPSPPFTPRRQAFAAGAQTLPGQRVAASGFLEEETQELCNDSTNLFSFNKLKNVSATSDKARTIPFPACFSPHTTAK
jgi:hypothetical protein